MLEKTQILEIIFGSQAAWRGFKDKFSQADKVTRSQLLEELFNYLLTTEAPLVNCVGHALILLGDSISNGGLKVSSENLKSLCAKLENPYGDYLGLMFNQISPGFLNKDNINSIFQTAFDIYSGQTISIEGLRKDYLKTFLHIAQLIVNFIVQTDLLEEAAIPSKIDTLHITNRGEIEEIERETLKSCKIKKIVLDGDCLVINSSPQESLQKILRTYFNGLPLNNSETSLIVKNLNLNTEELLGLLFEIGEKKFGKISFENLALSGDQNGKGLLDEIIKKISATNWTLKDLDFNQHPYFSNILRALAGNGSIRGLTLDNLSLNEDSAGLVGKILEKQQLEVLTISRPTFSGDKTLCLELLMSALKKNKALKNIKLIEVNIDIPSLKPQEVHAGVLMSSLASCLNLKELTIENCSWVSSSICLSSLSYFKDRELDTVRLINCGLNNEGLEKLKEIFKKDTITHLDIGNGKYLDGRNKFEDEALSKFLREISSAQGNLKVLNLSGIKQNDWTNAAKALIELIRGASVEDLSINLGDINIRLEQLEELRNSAPPYINLKVVSQPKKPSLFSIACTNFCKLISDFCIKNDITLDFLEKGSSYVKIRFNPLSPNLLVLLDQITSTLGDINVAKSLKEDGLDTVFCGITEAKLAKLKEKLLTVSPAQIVAATIEKKVVEDSELEQTKLKSLPILFQVVHEGRENPELYEKFKNNFDKKLLSSDDHKAIWEWLVDFAIQHYDSDMDPRFIFDIGSLINYKKEISPALAKQFIEKLQSSINCDPLLPRKTILKSDNVAAYFTFLCLYQYKSDYISLDKDLYQKVAEKLEKLRGCESCSAKDKAWLELAECMLEKKDIVKKTTADPALVSLYELIDHIRSAKKKTSPTMLDITFGFVSANPLWFGPLFVMAEKEKTTKLLIIIDDASRKDDYAKRLGEARKGEVQIIIKTDDATGSLYKTLLKKPAKNTYGLSIETILSV